MKQKHYDVESMAKLINFSDSRAGLYIVLFLFCYLNRQIWQFYFLGSLGFTVATTLFFWSLPREAA